MGKKSAKAKLTNERAMRTPPPLETSTSSISKIIRGGEGRKKKSNEKKNEVIIIMIRSCRYEPIRIREGRQLSNVLNARPPTHSHPQ